MIKTCEICQKEFKTYHKERRFCGKICAQSLKKLERDIRKCEYTGCTNTVTYVKNSTREKRFCSKKCQTDWQKYTQLGENNGNYGRENSWGKHSDERKKKISDAIKKHWSSEDRKIKNQLGREKYKLKNGHYPMMSEEGKEKISIATTNRILDGSHTTYINCERGYYFNNKNKVDEQYHSSWEKQRMIELDGDENVIYWTKKHSFIIKYEHNGKTKRYVPDFYIEYKNGDKAIEEVKGFIDDKEVFSLKYRQCKIFCENNNIKYVVNFMKNYDKYKDLIL